MKSIVSAAFVAVLLGGSIGCNNQNKPAPPPPAPAQDTTAVDTEDPENPDMISVEISGGAPVIPDPRRTATTVEMRKDGDLIPVFIKQISEGGGQPKAECSFSLTTESAIRAIQLLRKISDITQKEFAQDGPPMVGSGPKYFSVRRNGTEAVRLTVQLGAKADPSMTELEQLIAAEVADFQEAQKGAIGKLATFLEGKVWQSNTDPNRRISIREGRFVTFNKDGEEPGKPYVSMRRHCADGCGRMTKKALAEGMKAGFIGCMTLTGQDDECFLILEAEGKKLEIISTNEGAKSETFTHLKRG